MSVIDVVGHVSFALAAISFLFRDILLLRALSIASGLIGIAYNYFLPAGPLWLVIFWLSLFVAINGFRMVQLIWERRAIKLDEKEQELFETLFQQFTAVEFMKLMRIGEWRQIDPDTASDNGAGNSGNKGTTLLRQGDNVKELLLIYNGEAAVERDGREIARIRDGGMVGDMAYVGDGVASATVRVTRATQIVAWDQSRLQALMQRNPSMDIAMKTVLSFELSRKLSTSSAPG